MASYRPFPPPPQQPSFVPPPPAQNPLPPPPPRPQSHGNQYSQNWGSAPSFPQNYTPVPPNSSIQHSGYNPSSHQYQPPLPPPQQKQQYPFQPPPPPPDSSYPPPPPPPPSGGQVSANVPQQYYPSSQYSQFSQQQPPLQPLQPPPPQPPPPPSSPPPSSSNPPPPPPASPPPPPPQNKESGGERGRHERDRRALKEGNHHVSSRQQKPPVPPGPVRKANGAPGRVETEEEKRLRKKREMEKSKQEDRLKQHVKEIQNRQKQPPVLPPGAKNHLSISASKIGEKRATPVLAGDRDENPMKRQTAFMCRMKFRNELPDPSAQPKLMTIKRDKERFTRYTITSLEKMHKPKLYFEPDLGIPLDLLDLSVYNPPRQRLPLAPEDEELLRDDEAVTPLKREGIKRKDRPSDQGVSWLVKTQYISPLSNDGTKQSLTEKQAKEMREMKEGRNVLQNLNNRERQIQEIQASFEACKSRPVHATKKHLKPVEVLPLLPYFDRDEDEKFVVVNFDGEPTADSEMFSQLPKSLREDLESKAVMKSYTASSSDPEKPERFLGYMVPSMDELSKDIHDGMDVSYSWVREYNWDVKGEDPDELSTYLVSFSEDAARYLPLPTKLTLRKRRTKEGRPQEGEQFVQPGKITVRKREETAVIERKESMNYSHYASGPSRLDRPDSDIEEEQEPLDGDDALNVEDDQMGHYNGVDDDYMSD